MVVGGLAKRSLEHLAALLDGQAVIVRVPDHVRPPEVPRLERGGHGELVFELRERDVALVASPSLEHLRIIAGHVLPRTRAERHGGLRAPGETDNEEQAGNAHRAGRA
jgi:hypothetical protein